MARREELNRYGEQLKDEIDYVSAQKFSEAIEKLHSAMCRVDIALLDWFLSKPLLERVNDYARTEGLRTFEVTEK